LAYPERSGREDLQPGRYHPFSAIKLRLPGAPSLPPGPKATEHTCAKILEIIWDPARSERLVLDLLRALKKAVDAELDLGVPLGEMVRTLIRGQPTNPGTSDRRTPSKTSRPHPSPPDLPAGPQSRP
jgi:hypothetical protein